MMGVVSVSPAPVGQLDRRHLRHPMRKGNLRRFDLSQPAPLS
jgi:hypothetical protein